VDNARDEEKDRKKRKKVDDGIIVQAEVVNLGADFWMEVLAWGRNGRRLNPKDQQIIEVCASMPRRTPSPDQARHAKEVLQRMRDLGFGQG
jgi:hypothetical protein